MTENFFVRKIVYRIKPLKKAARWSYFFLKDNWHRFRINPRVTKILGYAYRSDPNKVDLITTYHCNLKCYDCSQMCRQAPSREKMTIEQVKRFISESKKAGKKWGRITVYGGESTLEPETMGMFRLLLKYKRDFSPKSEIKIITNGVGKKVQDEIKKLPEGIIIQNNKKTSQIHGYFISINAAPRDRKRYKDADFRNGCLVLNQCGKSLTKHGYYACPNAGSIDRIMGFNLGRKTLPEDKDSMREQLEKLCPYCGLFLFEDYRKKPGYWSKSWKKAFANYQKKKPKLDLY